MIYLFMGSGGGKTTNALGLALRAIGHKKQVYIYQFLKWFKKTGEILIEPKLEPYYKILQYGRKGWHGFSNLTEADKRWAELGLDAAYYDMITEEPFLMILDELNLVAHLKLLSKKVIVEFLKQVPEGVNVVLTGRDPPTYLIELADVVVKVDEIKSPDIMICDEGIQW